MFWFGSIALVVVLFVLLYEPRPQSPAPAETTYVVLVRTKAPTPSETVTAWNAYEAAPQTAASAAAAIHAFALDSGLSGEMRAIPLAEWSAERRTP